MVARRSTGFTLIEMLVVMGMLGMLIIALFKAFDYGASSFRRATQSQDSQSALRSIYMGLRDDLRKTHFSTVSLTPRATMVNGEEKPRHALCMASLIDWAAADSFDSLNGIPKWDRYLLYYATEQGLLVRTTIDPDRPDYSPAPFNDLDPERYFEEDPSQNTGYQSSYKVLSKDVLEFECRLDAATDTVEVDCFLLSDERRKNEISLAVFPQNTWPKGEDR